MFSKNKEKEKREEKPLTEPLEQQEADIAQELEEPEAPEEEPDGETEAPQEPAETEEPLPSLEEIEKAYCLGAGIDEDTLKRAKELLAGIADGITTGKFSAETIRLGIRLLNYDEEIEKARKAGYEAGVAEKMAENVRNRRAAAEAAEEVPHFPGTRQGSATLGNSIFDLARGVR